MKDLTCYQEKAYQIFQDWGFAINAPCVLEDISMFLKKKLTSDTRETK